MTRDVPGIRIEADPGARAVKLTPTDPIDPRTGRTFARRFDARHLDELIRALQAAMAEVR